MTYLLELVKENKITRIQDFIADGKDINEQDYRGYTALMIASLHYDRQIIAELLVEAGANLDLKNQYGETALMLASFRNDAKITRLLVDNGANKDIKNNEGKTALAIAEERTIKKEKNCTEIIELLSSKQDQEIKWHLA